MGLEANKTEKINIYQIRGVIRESFLKSYGSAKKVFILDDIASSSMEALNCLLKVLEEPPPETYFILITSKKDQLFPTIISRCQKFEFNPLTDKQMDMFVNKKLKHKLDENRAKELIDISSGSPGRLLRFMKVKDFIPEKMEPEVFFDSISKGFSGSSESLEKLHVFLEVEGITFRKSPCSESYDRLMFMEQAIESIKKNANCELAVSNMFLKLGVMNT